MRALALVPFLALAALAGSSACAARDGCASDLDCADLEACVDGACAPLDLQPAARGGCGADADCPAGERCREGRCTVVSLTSACGAELDPACADEGRVCGVDPSMDCGAADCVLPFVCRAPVGEKLGAYGCAADEECRTGLCVEGGCLRPCATDAGCPATFACRERPLPGGKTVRTCVGLEEDLETPARTLCRGDRDCTEGRVCRFLEVSPLFDTGREWPICMVPPASHRPTQERCGSDAECRGGGCLDTCQATRIDACYTNRCTQPCEDSTDCPPRYGCQVHFTIPTLEGRSIAYCALGASGCMDEVDCCPDRGSSGQCVDTWIEDETHCALLTLGPDLVSRCVPQLDGARPGALCAVDADCTSSLCVAAPEGFVPPDGAPPPPAGGYRLCSAPCDPDPRYDRCAQGVHPLTSCQDTPVAHGAATVPVRVCR